MIPLSTLYCAWDPPPKLILRVSICVLLTDLTSLSALIALNSGGVIGSSVLIVTVTSCPVERFLTESYFSRTPRSIIATLSQTSCTSYNRCEPVSYTHLRAHETRHDLVCRLLLEKKKKKKKKKKKHTKIK